MTAATEYLRYVAEHPLDFTPYTEGREAATTVTALCPMGHTHLPSSERVARELPRDPDVASVAANRQRAADLGEEEA